MAYHPYLIEMAKKKTALNIDRELWKKFSAKVVLLHGNRKISDVLEGLIRKYVEEEKNG